MPHAIRRIDVAGRDVTENLQTQLRKAGYHLHTSAEKEVVRMMKEKCCYIASNPVKEEANFINSGGVGAGGSDSGAEEFKLPDGNVVKLGAERFRAPEILFNPELIGLEYSGVQHVIVDSIRKVDLDLRKDLYGNIVLSGGTTLTKGFGDRMLSEVKTLVSRDTKIKIFAPPERKYSTWIGGSILAGLSTFRKVRDTLWIQLDGKLNSPWSLPDVGFCRRILGRSWYHSSKGERDYRLAPSFLIKSRCSFSCS